MPTFQVRAHGTYADLSNNINAICFAMGVANVLVYQHDKDEAERTHIHAYLFDAVYKIDKMRRECQRFFHGNAMYSLKQKAGRDGRDIDLEGATRYGSKEGKYHFVECKGFDPAQVMKIEDKYRRSPKVVVKENPYMDLYYDFEREFPNLMDEMDEIQRREIGDIYAKFNYLKTKAKWFVFQRNKCIWAPKCFNEYKCVLFTYCMRHSVPIDKNYKYSL